MASRIGSIRYHLPERVLTSAELSQEFPEWPVDKIESKTGIAGRHIAAEGECASDLAFLAAEKLFSQGGVSRDEIDFLLFCTQSPDYFLPTTACLLQDRLGLRQSIGALDFNLGCSGFVYGLGLADGLIASGSAKKVLLLTGETYSKFLHRGDKSVRTLFGDGASATVVEACEPERAIGPFVYGTNGAGGEHLIVPTGGMREARSTASGVEERDKSGNVRTRDNLYMNGGEIFTFTLEAVPAAVRELLAKSGKQVEDIDLFVPHQANQYMLETLRKQLKIDPQRFYVHLRDCGNTVSATIPIALAEAEAAGALLPGMQVMVIGFGGGIELERGVAALVGIKVWDLNGQQYAT